MKLDFSVSNVDCCSKVKLCDTTCEFDPCLEIACADGYGIGTNKTKYDIGSTAFNFKMPSGAIYNNVNLNFKPATRAYGKFTITGGTTGAIVVNINGLLVSNTVFMTDVETTLKNLVNTANGDSKNTGWHMELIGTDTIKVISNIPGVLYNGLDVNVGLSGDITVTMIDDPTAYGSGVDNCVEFLISDIYGTNTAPVGNSGPDFADGVYEITYIIYDLLGVEIDRVTKCILFDCNVKACVKAAVLKLEDGSCGGCSDDLIERVLKIKSKIEQAHAQLAEGLGDCANSTIQSAGKLCNNICLDC